MDDEYAVRAFDGHDFQLPTPFIVTDPTEDHGVRNLIGFTRWGRCVDHVAGASPTYPVLSAAPGEPDRLRLRLPIMSYTILILQYIIDLGWRSSCGRPPRGGGGARPVCCNGRYAIVD